MKYMATNDKAKKDFTFIDLFAGIGGFHIAFHNLGGKCIFASEWDLSARKTYEENFKKIDPELFSLGRFAGDITKVDEKEIPKFNILTGGFPCQPFSNAGYKKGFSDSRGTLFHDIVRIIESKKPDAFFIENVSHLLKHDNGRTFETIKDIIENQLGYSFHYKIVKGSDFGVPQHRARLFMVGFKNKNTPFSFPDPIPLKKTMSDILGGHCEKKIGYTLRVGGRGSGVHDRRNWDSYIVDGKVKRIGIEEGKKMMGLPNNFKFPVTEAQAMKQLGNSVVVPAIQATAKQILISLKLI
jgi:DNA (cytosine-5)-methyltransferase 1